MSITHTFNFSWTDGATPLTATVALVGSLEQNLSTTVTSNTANNNLALAWTNASLKSLWMTSNVALTIFSNNTTVHEDPIVLTANDPVVWYTGSGLANPFTNNVTALYANNASNTNAALNIRVLL